MSTPIIDFRRILGVYPNSPDFTCVGMTRSRQRCRNSFIKRSDLLEASNILDRMNRSDVHQTRFWDTLRRTLNRLAYLTLCPRWHRDQPGHAQTSHMVLDWFNLVESYHQQRSPLPPLLLPASPPLQTHTSPLQNSSATSYALPSAAPHHSQFPPHSPASPPIPNSSTAYYLPSPPPSPPALSSLSPSPVPSPNLPSYTTSHLASPPPSPSPSSSASAASILSRDSVSPHGNNSGYSTSYTTPPSSVHSSESSSNMSDVSLPFQGPAVVFPSPPSSVWSLGSASEDRAQSGSSTASSHGSSHSRSSRRRSQSAAHTTPSADPTLTALASSILESITPILVSHIAVVLANTIGASGANTNLASTMQIALNAALNQAPPLIQASAGTGRSSRRSSRRSSQGSLRTSTQGATTPANLPAPIQQASTSQSPQTIAGAAAPQLLLNDCYICYDTFADGELPECCSRCGHAVHFDCFVTWVEEQINQDREVVCGYCRSLWV